MTAIDGAARSLKRCPVVFALALATLAATPAVAAAVDGSVSGTVFRDLNANGARDAREVGEPGLIVRAFDRAGAPLGSATSDAAGAYTLAYTGAATDNLRLELEIPAAATYLRPAAHGPNNDSTVRFVAGPAATAADFAVTNPGEYCQTNPTLAIPCFGFGAATSADPALVSFKENATVDDSDGTAPGIQTHPVLSTINQVGSTYGATYSRVTDSLYLAATFKRHVGVGPAGLGAIYRVAGPDGPAPATTLLTTLPASAVGTDPHTPATNYLVDPLSFEAPGKIGLGDLEANEANDALYTVALADKRLYRVPVADPAAVTSQATPNPCAVPADWRPSGLAFKDGAVYVGGVCSAETSQAPADLTGHVYRSADDGATWTVALTFPLSYPRRCGNGANQGVLASTTLVAPTCGANALATWRPWQPLTNSIQSIYAQPQIGGLAFDGQDLVIGLKDRQGDQQGTATRNVANTATERPITSGDIIRACATAPGTFVLEANAACGPTTTLGDGTNQGPGGGEFYFQDFYPLPHDEIAQGAVFQVPGAAGVQATALDPLVPGPGTTDDGGVITFGNAGAGAGTALRRYRVFNGGFNTGTLGKANGLGDLEALCQAAPIELGNRVWFDTDQDGVQDPEERPIAGVTVRLLDAAGNELARAVTDAQGRYWFSSGPGTSTGSDVYGIAGLVPGTSGYSVRLDNAADYGPGGPLAGLEPTLPESQGAPGAGRDSNGRPSSPTDTRAAVDLGPPGANDHTIDFGFFPSLVPPPPPDPPPPAEPPAAAPPPAGPAPADVRLAKQASTMSATVGDQVTYTLTVVNDGPGVARGVLVTDRLPANVDFRAVSSTAGSCTQVDGTLTCALPDLAAGQSVVIAVQVLAARPGRAANIAVVTTTTPDPDPADNRCCTTPPAGTGQPPPPSTVTIMRTRLEFSKSASVREVGAGGLIRFRLTVRNPERVPVTRVRVCDVLPAGLPLTGVPRGARVSGRQVCWTIARLAPRSRRTLELSARAVRLARRTTVTNRATVNAREALPAAASAAVRIRSAPSRAGGVTG